MRICIIVALFLSQTVQAAPALHVLRQQDRPTLLTNGGFEQLHDSKLSGWRPAPKSFVLAPGEGRNDSAAIVCRNPSGEGWFGASQTLTLNRTNAAPLLISGWSKAAGVTGGADSGYALYVDLVYADGTPLWGQTAQFRTGTHDWEERRVMVFPEKPVKSLTLNCLFRGHGGQAWFDDVSVQEISTTSGVHLFAGAAVAPVPSTVEIDASSERHIATGDGLRLTAGR
jgi:hypothetical protein